ncbi:MAG: phage tail sheath family protein [Eubacteriales bacterium]|nr:phage tail sheath family protein [Eubacteriales bacterium]
MYKHRIETEEKSTDISIVNETNAGIIFAAGTSAVNMASDPYGITNVPVMISGLAEAKAKLGYSDDLGSYTLGNTIQSNFVVFQNIPAVFVNVLDPKKHKKALAEKVCAVTEGIAKVVDKGILLDQMVVKKDTVALVSGTDYIAEFEGDGSVSITLMENEKTKGASELKVSGTVIDPSMVTEDDVIGGYDLLTGKEEGLELVRRAYPMFGIPVSEITAPGWSRNPKVAGVMAAKTEEINGVRQAMALIDIDTQTYPKITDLGKAKSDLAINGRNCTLLWPMARRGAQVLDYSAVWAAAAHNTDAEYNNIPTKSASNELLNVTAPVTNGGTEDIIIDLTQAEYANSIGIVVMINDQGVRAYGNNTAAYPNTKDPKDRWIPCRRGMNWYRNGFVQRYCDRVDDPTDYRKIESFLIDENILLNTWAGNRWIAGGKITYNESENPIEQILDGKIVFHTNIAFWTPMEHIVDVVEFDPNIIKNALGGGE